MELLFGVVRYNFGTAVQNKFKGYEKQRNIYVLDRFKHFSKTNPTYLVAAEKVIKIWEKRF